MHAIMGIEKAAAWLQSLCREKFFKGCSIHESAKKNEKNICCLDCCISICPHCVHSHRNHRLLQVRRYVYHDVVRLEDLEKLFDCSNVQAYTINAAKVVFIRKRPQNRQFKGSGNYCTSCDRSLQEPFYHCSLGCKVEYVVKHYRDLSPFLRQCKTLELGPDFFIPHDMHDTVNYIHQEITNESLHSTIVDSDEQPMSCNYSSTSSGSENMSSSSMLCTKFVRKKKRSELVYVCKINNNNNIVRSSSNNKKKIHSEEDMATSMSRRKGIPQRSPIC